VLPDDLGGIIHISVRGSFLDADHPATGSILHAGSQHARHFFRDIDTYEDGLSANSLRFPIAPASLRTTGAVACRMSLGTI
jgi:hypothetical protein